MEFLRNYDDDEKLGQEESPVGPEILRTSTCMSSALAINEDP